MRHDRVQTVNLLLDGLDAAALGARCEAGRREPQALLDAAGVAFERIETCSSSSTCSISARPTRSPCRCRDAGARRHRRDRGDRARRLRSAYRRCLRPAAAGIPVRIVIAAHRGDRPAPALRLAGLRAGTPRHRSRRPQGIAAGLGRRTAGTERDPGHDSTCRSAPRSTGRRCWSSPTPPFSSIPACAAASTASAMSLWSACRMNLARTALLLVDLQNDFHALRRRLCARRSGQRRDRGFAGAAEAAGRCAARKRAAGSSRHSSRWCRARAANRSSRRI